ncbi:MAG: regulatory iron-sulfur-containing complex subunit RicT [Clostridia bacterium]|nr:regulatory iron-sulfur-containing complex subunit RicT [Clostridia bacterium]
MNNKKKEDVILGVRFQRTGVLYYMDPLHYGFRIGDLVVANSNRGVEIARVVSIKPKEQLDKNIEITKIIKPATKSDIEKQKEQEKEASMVVKKCRKIVEEMKLKMKIIHAEYTFDACKLTIYFVSDDRVDFRELVKKLAAEYKTRIELRQVGPRDEIKLYPNLGICGREVCCRTHLENFDTVTIKMAKEQGVQINMQKISGACGKLMCCFKYEEEVYKENMKGLPKVGSLVKYNEEDAKVIGLDVLNKKVRIRVGKKDEERYETVEADEIKKAAKPNKKGGE